MMPIDVDQVVGAELQRLSCSWSEKDIVLYNLAVGAGDPPTDPAELEYVYGTRLKAVPSFGTIPTLGMMMGLGDIEGLDIELSQVLHGDQSIAVHSPVPVSGTVVQTGTITDVFDKGTGALVVLEVVSTLEETNEPLFSNRSGVFVRGEGGFGGDSGPASRNKAPDRGPDHIVETRTLPQQALLYRMVSGDGNPLHADPGFAALAGFDRPILHGLCTYGAVLKAVIDAGLDGRTSDVAGYTARFSGHVFPGETLVTSMWQDEAGWIVSSVTKERGKPVLSNARVDLRS